MLRAVSSIYIESQALELFATTRRDVFKLFRTSSYSTAAQTSQPARKIRRYKTTVLKSSASSTPAGQAPAPPARPPEPPREPPPPPPHRRAWPLGAAALALTASIGGVYYYHKYGDEKTKVIEDTEQPPKRAWRSPQSAHALPAHAQFLLVGAGTAAFAAMRAIRSLRPDSQVLMVGEEPAFPYMRPPLSKELWREPALADAELPTLSFRQWNGRRRSVLYEPPAFYRPVEQLAAADAGGASVARGWRVSKLDVAKHEATLCAPGEPPVTITYDKVLVATGVRARRVAALRPAAAAGRALALRDIRDAQKLAAALDDPAVSRIAIVGGGFLATELSAALADRLQGTGKTVTQVYREATPLAGVLPAYLACEAARRLRGAGVRLSSGAVLAAAVEDAGVRLRLQGGAELLADLVVECVGGEVDESLARASGLETHPTLGGLLVNAELQARSDVYVAGDAACFYDSALGRRRVEHHDHAVVSGRLAGENMAAAAARPYEHQSMFWSDLGPHLGYEAIGIIDAELPTVGVFSADAVEDAGARAEVGAEAEAGAAAEAEAGGGDEACSRRYARGVVFYVRGRRVVGVLMWNLFNRMHVARRVLAAGEVDDLFEVAKLFDLHEED
ncbi:apoptosis-inducing factor 1, mitochondrial-like isoform X2 [Plodia interpunctella]|uniref:apoptosis-inducing factor 1, mitochondrial-like isoform X2 n=1 Tax=Plodia interpunctella TaxID=58824 RepID=UPI0023674677|nr:apoptosis-inducing factor 1, mitochondrial-like isoform X2 [Plodia interpunctella]